MTIIKRLNLLKWMAFIFRVTLNRWIFKFVFVIHVDTYKYILTELIKNMSYVGLKMSMDKALGNWFWIIQPYLSFIVANIFNLHNIKAQCDWAQVITTIWKNIFTMHRKFNNGITCRTRTAYASDAPDFIPPSPVFIGVRVAFILWVFV